MSTSDVLERLRETAARPGMFSLCARLERCWLGKSPEGRAALLIPCATTQGSLGRAFGALLLRFKPTVAFDVDGRTWATTCAIVECLDEALLPTFVALASDVASNLGAGDGPAPTDHVVRALASWELLLRSRSALTEAEQLGLWGELCFILSAPSIDGAIRAWSPGKRDVIDFVHGNVAVELKTSSTRCRHSLSYDQARSAGGDIVLFLGSLWVLPDAGGRSLADMVEAVASSCSEIVALEQKLLSCGFSRRHADVYSRRFATAGALMFFHANAIPQIRAFDPGISSMRYTIELDPAVALVENDAESLLRRLCGPIV